METDQPQKLSTWSNETRANSEGFVEVEDQSPVEQVALTVSTSDDPTLPVYTFRMWTIGIVSCIALAYINQFFSYRTEPITISSVAVQIAALPLGNFMAAILPTKNFRFPGTNWQMSLNPGPFNKKEHVLITIFANAGAGGAYAIGIVNIVKAFYKKRITFFVGLLITITTQCIGYGWAGIFRSYLVDPSHMWWPSNLVQVSLFEALHEKDQRPKGKLSRLQFFSITILCSFVYYAFPGYFFPMLTSLSWVCWIWPRSVTAQQLGSGLKGLGLGAFGLDWATVSAFLGSPLATPWFAIVNIMVGYSIVMYILTPLTYWTNVYEAKRFPLYSTHLYASDGTEYNFTRVIDTKFHLDVAAYNSYSKLYLSTFFVFSYGLGFATLAATITHVWLFNSKEIGLNSREAYAEKKMDVHTRIMKENYKSVPQLWYIAVLVISIVASLIGCEVYKEQLQLPWWGLLFACSIAFIFTLPLGAIAATTNQLLGLNVITELIFGYIYPGKPVANVCFKTYGFISMAQAVSFLADFKLGNYMKIPPRSMFLVQLIGTVIAALTNLTGAWWLLTTIPNICNVDLLPYGSPWTCPGDTVFFDASVIWGLVGPKRLFGTLGLYKAMNWFFLFGFLAPIVMWLISKAFPKQKWMRLVNMPLVIGSGAVPPASSVNYVTWFVVGFFFNYYIYRYRKGWWQRHNYILSAGLDAGLAFMGVLAYFSLGLFDKQNFNWWGANLDNCPLASCPTAPGIVRPGCPVFA
ncbi:hypothetical protein O6H91_10G085700 [Diphasiastrum complanatum]|uniref:Uncharacterized protein n=2 Tax=Diphasiastrum complanatum TaxID=34168 RepID=A0ACC2CJ91_DIPCM|nr:hypothetical protein O6H91_10G085700 [Diphasiastrum complanatum]KAJ7542018.1 hypothetical protein O6H91_10G085700 [Diphasiastrum complanatum]